MNLIRPGSSGAFLTPRQAAGGTRALHPGDITGRRAATETEAAKERQSVIDHTISELRDPDTQIVLVLIPGRTSAYALPKYVLDAIKRAAR